MTSVKYCEYDQNNNNLMQFFKSCSEQMCKDPVTSFSDSCGPERYHHVMMVTTRRD